MPDLQTPEEILRDLDAKLAEEKIAEDDYHLFRLRLLRQLTEQQDPDVVLFEPVDRQEVQDSAGDPYMLVDDGPFLSGQDADLGKILAPFCLAKYPVTVREFALFLDDSGYAYPDEDWDQLVKVSPDLDCPVSHVSYLDAKEFCRWKRKYTQEYFSLPHELEWEKAARGIDGRFYPWGPEEPSDEHACFQGAATYDATVPVAQFEGLNLSPYGCVGMVGNVWEWCLDSFDDPRDPHILRGGGWCNPVEYANCLARTFSYPPEKRVDFGGFRLVYLPHDMLVEYRRAYASANIAGLGGLRVVGGTKTAAPKVSKGQAMLELSQQIDLAALRRDREAPAARGGFGAKPAPALQKTALMESIQPAETVAPARSPLSQVDEDNDRLAQIIGNAAKAYLQSKTQKPGPARTPVPVRRAAARSAEAAPKPQVEIVDPTRPAMGEPGTEAVVPPLTATAGEALPMAQLGQLDEQGERARGRARLAARKVHNLPALTWSAFAVWFVFLLVVICVFVNQLRVLR